MLNFKTATLIFFVVFSPFVEGVKKTILALDLCADFWCAHHLNKQAILVHTYLYQRYNKARDGIYHDGSVENLIKLKPSVAIASYPPSHIKMSLLKKSGISLIVLKDQQLSPADQMCLKPFMHQQVPLFGPPRLKSSFRYAVLTFGSQKWVKKKSVLGQNLDLTGLKPQREHPLTREQIIQEKDTLYIHNKSYKVSKQYLKTVKTCSVPSVYSLCYLPWQTNVLTHSLLETCPYVQNAKN